MVQKETVGEFGSAAVRKRLMRAALELFTQKGYAATSVREIVAAAGVTKPVLYYYFKNKEGLYLELMREPFERFATFLDSVRDEQGRVCKRLLGLTDQVLALFIDNIDVARLMYSIYYGPSQGAPFFDFDSYHLKLQLAIQQLVEEGIATGELQSLGSADMMWAILGVLNVVMENELCHPEAEFGRPGLARVLTIILRGMAALPLRKEG